jgi:hypothetical protein
MLPQAKESQDVLSAAAVDSRMGQRLTLLEFAALLLCTAMVFAFVWFRSQNIVYAYDFETYLWAGRGDLTVHYYAYWILPVFRALTAVPPTVAFVIWNLFSIAGVFAASRVLGGGPKATSALLTYQMFYILFYGNIIGILLGGLALYWWGLVHRRWYLAGIGLTLILTKYQLGIPFGLIFLWLAAISWRECLHVLVVPTLALIVSLLFFPFWPLESVQTILNNPPNDLGNISLWQWFGPLALLLWIPPLFLPLSRVPRLLTLTATITLTLPYFQQTDLLALFVLPVGWLPLAGNLGFYLHAKYSWYGFWVMFIIPMTLYLRYVAPAMIQWKWGRASHT